MAAQWDGSRAVEWAVWKDLKMADEKAGKKAV
jgi:hypothetical protein